GTTANGLAQLLHLQGRHPEAVALFKRALSIWEKLVGPDHVNVASILNNLAALYGDMGQKAQAEAFCKRAISIYEKDGVQQFDLAKMLDNLAALYDEDRVEEAEALSRRALSILETVLGPDHPDVATALSNLSVHLSKLGRFTEAEPLLKRGLA